MNKKRYGLFLVLLLLLQSAFFSNWAIFGVRANLFLSFTLVLAMLYGPNWAGYTGLGLGLMEDIMFSGLLGLRALLYFLVGSLVGSMLQNNDRNLLTGMAVTVLSSLFVDLANQIFLLLLRLPVQTFWIWGLPVVYQSLFNVLAYLVLLFLCKRYLQTEKTRPFKGLGRKF